MPTGYLLIKVGALKHITSFYEKGEIYFNTISTFQLSKEAERGDQDEGLISLENTKGIKSISFEHPSIGVGKLSIPPNSSFKIKHYSDESLLSYSQYAITELTFSNSNTHSIDKRIAEFGSHCVIISNVSEFMKRVKLKLDKLGLRYSYGLIDYKDYNKMGEHELNIFNKNITYSHQNEYRIILESNNNSPLSIDIGPLEGIAKMHTTKELLKMKFSASR